MPDFGQHIVYITSRAPNLLKRTTMGGFIGVSKLQEPILWSVVTLAPYVKGSKASVFCPWLVAILTVISLISIDLGCGDGKRTDCGLHFAADLKGLDCGMSAV